MAVIKIGQHNFDEEVIREEKPVLLDFWAPWCGPCRMFSPTLEQIAVENPHIKVGKVNIDEEPEMAKKFRIYSIPTLVVMRGGKITAQESGARPKQAVLELL